MDDWLRHQRRRWAERRLMSAATVCLLCPPEVETSHGHSKPVAVSDHWAVTTFPGFEMPGWFFLQSVSHATSLDELSNEALLDMGRRLADAIAAIRRGLGCDKVYVFRFGEGHQHWHTLLCGLPDSVSGDSRGARYFLDRELFRDEELASSVADKVRLELGHWRRSDIALERF